MRRAFWFAALLAACFAVRPLTAQGGGFLGVVLAEAENGTPKIAEVIPESPAAKAGLRAGDVILEADGRRIRDLEALFDWIEPLAPGRRVKLSILRDGKRIEVPVVLGRNPSAGRRETERRAGKARDRSTPKPKPQRRAPAKRPRGVLGVELAQAGSGRIWIDKVEAGGPAERAGLQEGDVVLEAGGRKVQDIDELVERIQAAGAGAKLKLKVLRRGRPLEITAVLGGAAPEPGPAARRKARRARAPKVRGKAAPVPEIHWFEDLARAKREAKRRGAPLLLDFRAEWCGPCRMLDKSFAAPAVRRLLARLVPVRIDVDREEDLADRYGVSGIPHVVVEDLSGRVLGRFTGYVPAAELAARLERYLGLERRSRNPRAAARRARRRGAAARGPRAARSRAPAARKPAARKPAARTPAARKPAASAERRRLEESLHRLQESLRRLARQQRELEAELKRLETELRRRKKD